MLHRWAAGEAIVSVAELKNLENNVRHADVLLGNAVMSRCNVPARRAS